MVFSVLISVYGRVGLSVTWMDGVSLGSRGRHPPILPDEWKSNRRLHLQTQTGHKQTAAQRKSAHLPYPFTGIINYYTLALHQHLHPQAYWWRVDENNKNTRQFHISLLMSMLFINNQQRMQRSITCRDEQSKNCLRVEIL